MSSPKYRPRVLISAASKHGSTTEIARVIGNTLITKHIAVDIVPPAAVDSIEDYDAVILGSAVYAGHWVAEATLKLSASRSELHSWCFAG